LFADGRVRTLEDQASDVIGSASEMGGTLVQAAQTLQGIPAYRERFAQVFHIADSSAITSRTLRLAVAAYVRSLVSLNAPFDRAMRGEHDALTAQQRLGFNVFMGKARCGTCHFAPLFHGAAPPPFVESEPEVLGVPLHVGAATSVVDPDSGRFNVRRIDLHLHAFKTPTLRNIALTAPYMHNGSFGTLESVIDFYDAGGGAALGLHLPNQTLPLDSLHLSRREKRAIVSFLHSLTDTSLSRPRVR
jgi:cytochrome c peroxidase